MEQVIDWLNENELRSYPLMAFANKSTGLSSLTNLPDNFLLDLQLITTQELGKSSVALTSIVRQDTPTPQLTVTFGTITSFIIPTDVLNDPAGAKYPYYVRNPDGCLAVFGPGATTLYAALATTKSLQSLNIQIEPALCIQFNGALLGVSSVSASPEKVGDVTNNNTSNRSHPKLPLVDVLTAAKLTGNVQLLEGYNFRVNINNSLIDSILLDTIKKELIFPHPNGYKITKKLHTKC
jgi:hypothetical protein